MITTYAKNFLIGCFALMLVSLCVVHPAYAAPAHPEVVLAQSGDDIDVTINKSATDVSALSLNLNLNVKANSIDAVTVRFDFSDAVKNASRIHDYRVDTVSDEKSLLSVYIAGGNDLFAQGSLYIGKIVLGLDTQKSAGAQVTVSIPEGGKAIQTVYNGYTENSDDELYLEKPFTAYLGSEKQLQETPQPGEKPVGGDLPATGDEELMLIGILLVIAALSFMCLGVYRWKKAK